MRSRRLKAELIAVKYVSNLGVILHGSVHHHKVRQECPQVRNCPLHDPLLRDRQTEDPSVDVNAEAEVGNSSSSTQLCWKMFSSPDRTGCSSLLWPLGEAFRHIIDGAVDKQASGAKHVHEQESFLKNSMVFWGSSLCGLGRGLTRSLCCWCLL